MASAQDIDNRIPIIISVMAGVGMQALDTTIANVAIPHMQGGLSAGAEQITWVLTSYIVAAAIMTPLSGWLGDRFGRKRVFLAAIALFTLASGLCGLAVNLPEMVTFRFLQGLAGASLVPLSQAELLDLYPAEQHGKAMAIWTGGTILAPIAGPVLGGYITDQLSWRWCFYINLPVGLMALLGVWTFMSQDREKRARPFDFTGFAMLALALTCLQLVLDRGPHLDWFTSPEIRLEASLAAAGLWIFVTHSLTTRHPFFSPRLLADGNLLVGTVLIFLTVSLFYAVMALTPPFTQNLLGYPAQTAGLLMAPRGMAGFLFVVLLGSFASKVEPRFLLAIGFAVTAFATWLMTRFELNMPAWPLIVTGFLQGAGVSTLMLPVTTLSFTTLAPELRSEGSSFFSLMRNLSGGVGISMMQFLIAHNTQAMHASLAGRVDLSDPLLAQGFPEAFDPSIQAGAVTLNAELTRQASMVAYVDIFWLITVLLVVFAPLGFLLRTPKRRPAPEELIHAME